MTPKVHAGWIYLVEFHAPEIHFFEGNNPHGSKFENRTTSFLKFGFSTQPLQRITNLRREHPTMLCAPIGAFPGTLEEERELHTQFDHLRIHGEYYVGDTQEIQRYFKLRLEENGRAIELDDNNEPRWAPAFWWEGFDKESLIMDLHPFMTHEVLEARFES